MKRFQRVHHIWQVTRPQQRWVMLAGMLVVHFAAATAWAQQEASAPEEEGGLLKWGIAAGLAVVVCISAFLNPKRSHLS
ncbi:MAG: hypothetical protein WBE26_19530 [Phycisphaerae bacterium]